MRERGEEESKSDYDNVDDDGDAAPRVSHGRPSRLTCFRGSSGSEGGITSGSCHLSTLSFEVGLI